VTDDRRLIEDLIPVEAISVASVNEKIGGRRGHPSAFHLWWARRPLAAARAAVYATLVRAADTPEEARSPAYFRELCKWGAGETAIADARARVLAANDGVPPKVLDLFAGGGAIPLEAARLGCEATAVELNPVAHLIQRCMLDYPQRFGPSLADDIRHWGERWVARAWERVGHLYPRVEAEAQTLFEGEASAAQRAAGRPIAYLWTRTVPCPNQALGAHEVPLVRQTWLAKKKGRHVALKPSVDRDALHVDWEVVEAADPAGLGFDPAAFSKRGSSACLICGATVDGDYVKAEGRAKRMGITPLAAVMVKAGGRGRDYRAVGDYPLPGDEVCEAVLEELKVSPPDELIIDTYRQAILTPLYGLTRFRDLFTPRQLATLCAFAQGVRESYEEMRAAGVEEARAEAVSSVLGLSMSRLADWNSSLCRWHPGAKQEGVMNTYARQALPMVWDLAEANPFGGSSGDALAIVRAASLAAEHCAYAGRPGHALRSSATQLSLHDESFDAVITDPPYYDNISYSDLSDFFYVWLKRSVGFLFPDHLAGDLTPKRHEAVMASHRHDGSRREARAFYEQQMAVAFAEAHRVLKPRAPLVCVYAHKTTLGWASLVEALRRARFAITEAWPLDTEMPERSRGQNSSALASSIFLVARRRERDDIGALADVQHDLDAVIAERLDRLTAAGVSGSDLVIAAIGAGLQPYTRYASVELPNGEELPAERFLEDVQARVLAAVLRKVHGLGDEAGAVDAATRYYVLARTFYGYAAVDFDEANNLARTVGVELSDLGHGPTRLASVGKGKVALLDFSERGEEPELGITANGEGRARVIDVAHGLLWRASHQRHSLREYLDQARPDAEALRWVVQALQGEALRDGGPAKHPEAQACERLLGAWRTVVEDNLFSGSA
jgi:putative DNA methylase